LHDSKVYSQSDGARRASRFFFIPVPKRLGVFILILTAMLLVAGMSRGELALSLVGALFLVTLTYCFLATLLLALFSRKKAAAASARILTREVRAGGQGELGFALGAAYQGRRFLRLPGIIVRYEMRVMTKDGRRIRHIVDPDALSNKMSVFPVPERGAYYGAAAPDFITIFDAQGFFHLSLPVLADTGCRLLATPRMVEAFPIHAHSGGAERRNTPHFQRTDNLTDHRPYIPGDDPRRINWKLYGHAGDLFIREGEPEPPPHSKLVILVDTEFDSALYTLETARYGIDLLCENALAIAVEYTERGMAMSVGYTGGVLMGGDAKELAAHLAYPAACPLANGGELPAPPEERGVIMLALPREATGNSALDSFLVKREARQTVDIFFLSIIQGVSLTAVAEKCARFYCQKSGVYARFMPV
jgi:hypothetical protein